MSNFINKLVDFQKTIDGMDIAKLDSEVASYQKNADEVEHTTNTGYGAELVPTDVLSNTVYNTIPEYATFLTTLPGFHGNNMGASEKVAIVGETGFARGNGEWTTGAGAISQGTRKLATWSVTITQEPLIFSIDISKRLKNYSILDTEAYVAREISKVATRTIESMIINADSSDGATGNVNLDDAQPSVTFIDGADDHRLLTDNGMRKLSLSGTADIDYTDIGVLEFNDFITTRSLLGDYSSDLDNILLFMNTATYNKSLTLDEFKKQSDNGITSTIVDGRLQRKLAGVEYVVNRDFPLTEADWKVSTTATNNTKGGLSYLYKPAVQWGYGQSVETDIVKIPGKGVSVIATFEVWFTIVNKKAGFTSPSVALGINITV